MEKQSEENGTGHKWNCFEFAFIVKFASEKGFSFFFFPWMASSVLFTINTKCSDTGTWRALCRWEKSIIIYAVSIWTYIVASIIQLLLLATRVCLLFPSTPCFTDSKHGCNCNSIRDGTTGSDFLHHALCFCLPAFSYQWLNTSVGHASTICSFSFPSTFPWFSL